MMGNTKGYIGNLPIPLCTVGEFEAVTGVCSQTIRQCIHEGELPATRVGHRWFIRTDKFLGYYQADTINLPYKGTAPTRAHKDDAGLDLRVAEGRWLYDSGIFTMVDTGTAVDIPKGHVGLLVARSSLCHKGLMLANGVGVIDPGYHGTIKVPLVSFCRNANIDAGERIAQLVIVPIADVEPVEVEEFEQSERGNGGFGSTGRN